MARYNFSYYTQDDCGSEFPISTGVTRDLTFHDESPWDVVLTQFIDFLSSIYGYNISESVDVQTFEQRMAAFRDNEED